MAQTGYTPILIYSSSTASAAPAAGSLTNSTLGSELAINITDGKLFYKDNANAVQVIGWKTVPTSAGGTGLTSYSQGDLLYYNSGTTLTALAKNTTATRYLSNTGTNNNPAWAQVNLANGVTGTLPVGNGGTGLASWTANGIVYASGTTTLTNGTALQFNGTNMGIDVAPAAWFSNSRVLQLGQGGAIQARNNTFNVMDITCNAYLDSSGNYTYLSNNPAAGYLQSSGIHYWKVAAAGTGTITGFNTNAMVLHNSGGLSLGNVTDPGATNLSVTGSATAASFIPSGSSVPTNGMYLPAANTLSWATNSTRYMTLDSSGNLLVNNTTTMGRIGSTLSSATTTFSSLGYGMLSLMNSSNTNNNYSWITFTESNGNYTAAIGSLNEVHAAGSSSVVGSLVFATKQSGSGGFPVERARITSAGGFTCAGIYNTTVGATNRDVFVDNGGVVGYVSSLRASKTNIQNLTDTSWLYQLNPVTFNYRKKDKEGNYTEETDGDIQYGMIAEDVEQVRSDLCFYDEVDGQQELRGIQYSKLVPVMLKALQQQKILIDALQSKLIALENK